MKRIRNPALSTTITDLVIRMVEYVGQVAQCSVSPVVERADARPGPALGVQLNSWHSQPHKPRSLLRSLCPRSLSQKVYDDKIIR